MDIMTKVRVLWEDVKALADKVKEISNHTLPGTTSATAGQILKLTGADKTPTWADEYSYTPPAYSDTDEVNTGKKWIDGKDIYCKVFTGTTSDTTTGLETIGTISPDSIINFMFYYNSGNDIRYTNIMYVKLNGDVTITKSATVAEKDYSAYVYYTHPDPTPETRSDDPSKDVTNYDPEPETRKRKTKKEDK